MATLYIKGQKKKRPGLYKRIVDVGKEDFFAPTAPIIPIVPEPDDPGGEDDASTTAVLGKAVLGKMKLGRS